MRRFTKKSPELMSLDLTTDSTDALKVLFPEAFAEGKINFDVLRQLLGEALEEGDEKFGLTWHGKRRARQIALTPSTGTLRPYPKDSVDWDTTQNLMLEGDNLEILKLLQRGYSGQIKCIYIDPPYNTGNDFVYPDDFQDNIRNYLALTGQIDSNGKKLNSNTESSGRFHADWLNMMYPRLKLAKNLLREDGIIFISIGDEEVGHLRDICDEIFGEENFEGHIHWRRRHNQPNDPTKMIGLVAEHIISYSKNKPYFKSKGVGKIELTGTFSNPDNDPRGEWASKPWKVGSDQSGSRYKITTPSGKTLEEEWMGDESTYKQLLKDKRIIFPSNGDGNPRKKYFKSERQQEGQSATNWWPHEQFGHNQGASSDLAELLGEKNVFSNPKPIQLISNLIQIANCKDGDIVLDFFAGSGTTGHAVMSLNASDGVNRHYILVQLPEALDPENKDQETASEFCNQLKKPRTIAELTKERLRRAAKKIGSKNSDVGFRVLRLDSSNLNIWTTNPDNLEKSLLDSVEHLKDDRTDQDILFELMLKLGISLTASIEIKNAKGKAIYLVEGGMLLACLAKKIIASEVEQLALELIKWHQELAPSAETHIVFRDSAFTDDVAKANLTAILQQRGLDNIRSI